MEYDLPDVIEVRADGPVRIVRLTRPEQLNAVNDELHRSLARVFPQLSADADARVAVITGEGRAFSAGGDFDLLDRMSKDRMLRRNTLAEGREIVINMLRCRIPVIAGIWPLVSYRNAEFLANEVPGVVVPKSVLKRMERITDKDAAREEGLAIARETLLEVRDTVQGVQVSAPFGRVQYALDVFSVL